VANWDDVRRLALALPDTNERLSRDLRQWRVHDKLFVWERPLRRADLEALGNDAPDGPILGARVEHLGAKEALLADDRRSSSPRRTSTATRRSWRASTRSPSTTSTK
jgi:hypothetical protein